MHTRRLALVFGSIGLIAIAAVVFENHTLKSDSYPVERSAIWRKATDEERSHLLRIDARDARPAGEAKVGEVEPSTIDLLFAPVRGAYRMLRDQVVPAAPQPSPVLRLPEASALAAPVR